MATTNEKKYTVKYRNNEVFIWETDNPDQAIDISEARRTVADHYKQTYYSVLTMDDKQFLEEFQIR